MDERGICMLQFPLSINFTKSYTNCLIQCGSHHSSLTHNRWSTSSCERWMKPNTSSNLSPKTMSTCVFSTLPQFGKHLLLRSYPNLTYHPNAFEICFNGWVSNLAMWSKWFHGNSSRGSGSKVLKHSTWYGLNFRGGLPPLRRLPLSVWESQSKLFYAQKCDLSHILSSSTNCINNNILEISSFFNCVFQIGWKS